MKYKSLLLSFLFVPSLLFDYDSWVLELGRRFKNKKLVGNYTIDTNGLEIMRDVLRVDFQQKGFTELTYVMNPNDIDLYIYFSPNHIMSTAFSFITKSIDYMQIKSYFERIYFTKEKMNGINEFIYEFNYYAYFQDLNFFFSKCDIDNLELKNLTIKTTKRDDTSFQLLLHIWYKTKKFNIQISASITNKHPFDILFFILIIIVKLFFARNVPLLINVIEEDFSFMVYWIDLVWNVLELIFIFQLGYPFHDFTIFYLISFIIGFSFLVLEMVFFYLRFYTYYSQSGFIKYFLGLVMLIAPFYLLYHYPFICDYIFYFLFFSTFLPKIAFIQLHKIKYCEESLPIFIPFFINKIHCLLLCILCGQKFPNIHINLIIFFLGLIVNIIQLIVIDFQNRYGYHFYKYIFKKRGIDSLLISYEDILRDNTKYKNVLNELCFICLNKLIQLEELENFTKNKIDKRKHEGESKQLNSTISTINTSEKKLFMNEEVSSLLKIFIKINKKKGIIVTPCNHLFHPHCIKAWWKLYLYCPICYRDLTVI